jgi:hypothetical protein
MSKSLTTKPLDPMSQPEVYLNNDTHRKKSASAASSLVIILLAGSSVASM